MYSARAQWRALLLTALVWNGALALGNAQEATPPVQDTQEKYRIAIIDFYFHDSAPEFDYLRLTIPNLLEQRLRTIALHHLTGERLDNFARYVRQQKLNEVQTKLNEGVVARDTEQLRGNDITTQEESIEKLRAELQRVEELNPADIIVQTPKTVEFIRVESSVSRSVEALSSVGRKHNADLIIGGTLSHQDEFLLIEPFSYARAEDTIRTQETLIGGQDEISLLGDELADNMATIVRGKEWGNAVIQGVTGNTEIRLNGAAVGYGNIALPYLDVGPHTVEAIPGVALEGETQEIEVYPGALTEVHFDFSLRATELVRVESDPPGAVVYLDATWQGITPVDIAYPLSEHILLLKKEGYFDAARVIDPSTPDTITLTLQPSVFDTGEWLHTHRDNFYTSLAFFILSIPIPIILGGIAENIANYQASSSFSTTSIAEQNRLRGISIGTLGAQYAGIFLSAVLAVNTIIELVRYVDAADLFHRL